MRELRDIHAGQEATIVGKGPSILRLRARDIPPGPVIALNHAILVIRELGLAQPVYSMQKDGCVPHASGRFPVPIDRCICPNPAKMTPPREPEVLLLSAAESSRCFPDYPRRHVFDTADFGLPWNTMSCPVAVRIAALMGCTSLLMLGHDAYTRGDFRRVEHGLVPSRRDGYRRAALQAQAFARAGGLGVEFR